MRAPPRLKGNIVWPVGKHAFAAVVWSALSLSPTVVFAETISGALAKAYSLNSQLNSARAGERVTDEGVAIAKSGYRPVINGTGNVDYSSTRFRADHFSNRTVNLTTGSFGVEIRQNIFDGFQTKNNVAAATARVMAGDESLRNTEQNVLLNAASSYMDVIRDRQIAVLRERNLQFLIEQVRAANSRFEVGEGTRTDVAQAEASRSSAVSQLATARAFVTQSEAIYTQVVGEQPHALAPASALANLLPKSLNQAMAQAEEQHPAILATQHLVDAAAFSVKSAEGALLPQVTASANVIDRFEQNVPDVSLANGSATTAGVGVQLTVPIYQGGRTSAIVRQSKESLGQARIDVDVQRDQVRAAVTSAWTQYIAAVQSVAANRDVVAAAQLALDGVIEERNVGQRTTLDVLNQQADVIDAQINLASSERDAVVASYAILSATGTLSPQRLSLQVAEYRPQEHYIAVKDKWLGLRTPDGR
jgi:outer membrane protein